MEHDGDRAAAVDWGCGGVWELRETRAVLKAESARAEHEGEWVQEVAGVPRGAVGEARGGLRPPTAAGSAAQRRRR